MSYGIPGMSYGIPGMSYGIPGMSYGMPGMPNDIPGRRCNPHRGGSGAVIFPYFFAQTFLTRTFEKGGRGLYFLPTWPRDNRDGRTSSTELIQPSQAGVHRPEGQA